jgi:hypothetical protein
MPMPELVHSTNETDLNVVCFTPGSTTRAPRPAREGGAASSARQPLCWRHLMLGFAEIERRLLTVLATTRLPAEATERLQAIGAEVVAPIMRRDGRRLAGDWRVVPGFLWRRDVAPEQTALPAQQDVPAKSRVRSLPLHLRGLTPQQLDDYRVLKNKGGYSQAEALAMVQQPAKREVRA